MSKVTNYQKKICELLEEWTNQETFTEWSSNMGHGIYSPRVDVAAGPFAIEAGMHREPEHADLLNGHIEWFRQLAGFRLENLGIFQEEVTAEERELSVNEKVHRLLHTNQNARCFVAIEIENKVSRKHLMGGAVNCSVLGKVGIAVGFTEEMHRCFLNLNRYFDFLRQVDNPTFNTANLLIVSEDQLLESLSVSTGKRGWKRRVR